MTLLPVRLRAMQHISLRCPTLFLPPHPCFFLCPPTPTPLQDFFFFQKGKEKTDAETMQSVGGRKMSLMHRNPTCSCCFNKKPKIKAAKTLICGVLRIGLLQEMQAVAFPN